MKRFLTAASAAVIMGVSGTMLATPAQASTRAFACTDEQIEVIIAVSDWLCGGGDWYSWGTCYGDGSISGNTICL